MRLRFCDALFTRDSRVIAVAVAIPVRVLQVRGSTLSVVPAPVQTVPCLHSVKGLEAFLGRGAGVARRAIGSCVGGPVRWG